MYKDGVLERFFSERYDLAEDSGLFRRPFLSTYNFVVLGLLLRRPIRDRPIKEGVYGPWDRRELRINETDILPLLTLLEPWLECPTILLREFLKK